MLLIYEHYAEIVSRRFFESEAYQSWFNYVDQNSTGIYSSRYGDAPIRSAGLSMFVDPQKVAWFGRQIGCKLWCRLFDCFVAHVWVL